MAASAKKALRKIMVKALKKLSDSEVRAQSEAVAAQLFSLDEFKKAKHVACFTSMPSLEIKTDIILARSFKNEKRVFIPRCLDDCLMEMLELRSEEELQEFAVNQWKIPEPPLNDGRNNAIDEGLDLLVVPGMAFDEECRRLGHGKSFYDRYITRYDKKFSSLPYLVGIALSPQLVDEVPVDQYDRLLDMIITPAGSFKRTKS